ncbi:transposable element Tcb1 transposase [Trichonephila clavipes]|nr:transposable element Tcb1 transposase [Trichonephila clavipes]
MRNVRKKLIEWCMKEGLIALNYECSKCNERMGLYERKSAVLDGDFEWVCSTITSQNIYGRTPMILLTMRPSRLFVKIRCHAVASTRKRSAQLKSHRVAASARNQSVRRHLDAFTRGRTIGKLEEGRSVTRTAIRGFSRGRPRGTTTADDRYIVLQARRNRRQTAGEIARHTTQATGRPISRFTVARRLHGGGLFARRPVRCVPLTPAHRRRRSLWCRENQNWRDNEWGLVMRYR